MPPDRIAAPNSAIEVSLSMVFCLGQNMSNSIRANPDGMATTVKLPVGLRRFFAANMAAGFNHPARISVLRIPSGF